MAKTTPYPPCTVTASWLKYRDRDRCLRRVTLTEPYRRAVRFKGVETKESNTIDK